MILSRPVLCGLLFASCLDCLLDTAGGASSQPIYPLHTLPHYYYILSHGPLFALLLLGQVSSHSFAAPAIHHLIDFGPPFYHFIYSSTSRASRLRLNDNITYIR